MDSPTIPKVHKLLTTCGNVLETTVPVGPRGPEGGIDILDACGADLIDLACLVVYVVVVSV